MREATAQVAHRARTSGFLQVGERVVWRADPSTGNAVLGACSADADVALEEAYPYREHVRFHSRRYRWAEVRGRSPAGFKRAGSSSGPRFDDVVLDGDAEAVAVHRHVRVPRST